MHRRLELDKDSIELARKTEKAERCSKSEMRILSLCPASVNQTVFTVAAHTGVRVSKSSLVS